METKVCNKCNTEKPITDYYKNRGSYLNACKVCHNSYSRDYYHKNSRDRRAYYKTWRAANPDKMAASAKNWRETNRLRVNELWARREALKKSLQVEDVCYETIRRRDESCYLCGEAFTDAERWDGELTHVDHKIPLSRLDLNPTHSYENCALTHKACNLSKKDKTPEEYLSQ